VRRLKAGPAGLELEWERQAEDVHRNIEGAATAETTQATSRADSEPPGLTDELERLVEVSPSAAVLESYSRIERQLLGVLSTAGVALTRPVGAAGLARLAYGHGLIDAHTRSAVEGLAVLRNLVAHGQAEVNTAKARDFVALADSTVGTVSRSRGTTFTDAAGFVGLLGEHRQSLSERQPCRLSWSVGPGAWNVQLLTSHAFELHDLSDAVWYVGIYADNKDKELMFTVPVIGRPRQVGRLLIGDPTFASEPN
jgi:hypothetical protein